MKRAVVMLFAACFLFFCFQAPCFAIESVPSPTLPLPPAVSDELGQLPEDAEQIVGWLDVNRLLGHFGEGMQDAFLAAVRCFFVLAAVAAISAAMTALSESVESRGIVTAFAYVTVLAGASASATLLKTVFEGAVRHMHTLSAFASGVIPVYAGICTASGMNGVSLAAGGGLSLLAAFAALIADNALLPLLRICCVLGFSSALSDIGGIAQISLLVRRFFVGTIGAVTALLTAVFAFQTGISAGADSLAGRAFRYVASSALPLVGGALSEASRTLSSAFSLMSAVAGGVGVAVVLWLMLPVMLELWALRLSFLLAGAVADILSLSRLSGLYRDAGALLGALMAILALLDAVLIFEFAMIMRMG